jgi:host factor-I protein
MNRPQINLQDTFLNQVRKENISVIIYLIGSSVQLRGLVRGFDPFTILLDSPGKPTQLVYKHAVSSVVPTRPLPNIYQEALRESGQAPSTPEEDAAEQAPAAA